MKSYLFLAGLIATFLVGCQSEQGAVHQRISQLEKAVETTPPTVTLGELLEAYDNFSVEFPEETQWIARYQYRKATVHYRTGDYVKAVSVLNKAIANYTDAEATPNSYLLLADIYKNNFQNENNFLNAASNFVITYPNHERASEIKATFPEQSTYQALLDSMELKIYNDNESGKLLNRAILPVLALQYENYGNMYPDADNAVSIINKAATTYRSINQPKKALALWQRIYENYPVDDFAPKALFQMALCYDDDLNDEKMAEQLYSEFLKKYPNDPFVEAAQFSLENLGKSLDEVIEGFGGEE